MHDGSNANWKSLTSPVLPIFRDTFSFLIPPVSFSLRYILFLRPSDPLFLRFPTFTLFYFIYWFIVPIVPNYLQLCAWSWLLRPFSPDVLEPPWALILAPEPRPWTRYVNCPDADLASRHLLMAHHYLLEWRRGKISFFGLDDIRTNKTGCMLIHLSKWLDLIC
jgi:hypothetical protein